MVYTNYSFLNVFQYEFNDVYFCTADIGWITGHSYILYGPLSAGATSLMFEGIPNYPSPSRFWEITDKFKVNQLYTAPTAIRSLMSCGLDQFEKTDLSSLKVLGTVGEPINKEAWDWYFKYVGKKQCPIVDTWWQTETGGILISNLAGITKHKPTYATKPLPGIRPALMDEKGLMHSLSQANLSTPNTQKLQGNLVVEFPWPGMIRTVWGDHKRCKQTYFSSYSGKYFTGDGCFKDTDQDYRITGRVDDVLNVSGHRIGTAEVENAINACENVIESAVIGYPHPIKGEGIYAYIICQGEVSQKAVNDKIKDVIGPIAKCDKVQLVSGLPKTRSGKIMRRILRKIASGEQSWGDASTLLNPEVVDEIWKNRVV
jgi:acetyl-CoA synthetase